MTTAPASAGLRPALVRLCGAFGRYEPALVGRLAGALDRELTVVHEAPGAVVMRDREDPVRPRASTRGRTGSA